MEASASVSAIAPPPQIAQLNVSKNSTMHIGPKFVSVTQNVQSVQVVKGVVLGLELQAGAATAGAGSRRLRCSVAVFVCWALVVAATLAFLVLRFALTERLERLDLEVRCARYLWEWARRMSRAEWVACVAALVALATCAALLAVFVTVPHEDISPDVAPHEWNITRNMWLSANNAPESSPLPAQFQPLRLVVVQHSVSGECHRFADCAAAMRNLQLWFMQEYLADIPYSFVIGNEGRAYEGRGWGKVGAHTRTYNQCALGLGFIGDYRTSIPSGSRVTELQLQRAQLVLAGGVRDGWLHPRYLVVGASDISNTVSPGDNLLDALRLWPHYAPEPAAFRNRTCPDIYAELRAEDDFTTSSPDAFGRPDA